MDRNLLKFNTVKCKVLHLGKKNTKHAVGHPAGKLPHKICTSTNIMFLFNVCKAALMYSVFRCCSKKMKKQYEKYNVILYMIGSFEMKIQLYSHLHFKDLNIAIHRKVGLKIQQTET